MLDRKGGGGCTNGRHRGGVDHSTGDSVGVCHTSKAVYTISTGTLTLGERASMLVLRPFVEQARESLHTITFVE